MFYSYKISLANLNTWLLLRDSVDVALFRWRRVECPPQGARAVCSLALLFQALFPSTYLVFEFNILNQNFHFKYFIDRKSAMEDYFEAISFSS